MEFLIYEINIIGKAMVPEGVSPDQILKESIGLIKEDSSDFFPAMISSDTSLLSYPQQ